MKCSKCGKDLNESNEDNMSYRPNVIKCEECFYREQSHLKDGCPDDCSLCGEYCVYDDKINN